MSRILFKYATRSRPFLFLRGIKSICDTVTGSEYEILVTADLDDRNMNNEFVLNETKKYPNITWAWGESRNKIHAINRDMNKAKHQWDILVNMSDDMVFVLPGWDTILKEHVKDIWGDSTDWFAHYNDGYTQDKIPSMSIMGIDYYKRTNRIYPEIYKSLWADNHAMEEAKILGRYHYFDWCLYQHFHPANSGIPQDDLYKFNESYYDEDKETFMQQKLINFGYNVQTIDSDSHVA